MSEYMREQILTIIEKNSRIDLKELAIILGVEEVDIVNEMEQMEKEGIICGYHTLIDWEKTNVEKVNALIEVRVTPQRGHGFDSIAERIYKYPEVHAVYLISGGYDLLVSLEGKTLKEVSNFVSDKLSTLDSVLSTATHFILKKYKLQQIMAGAWQLRIDTSAIPMADSDKWEGFYQFGVILIFLVLFAITLLPYVVAIMWYYIQISHKLEELLQQEKEQKKAYDKARNLMLSDITHDIKTPITTICGYAKTLSDGVIPLSEEKRQEYLQAIYAKSMRMSELVTMLFEYIKMDSEGFALHKEKTDVCELLREVIAMMYTDFEEKGMELEIEIPDKLDSIELDKSQMTRVITNILNNALKYNDAGTKVGVTLDEEYRICIADTGRNIEPELAEHIFEPFSRGDKARSTRGGSGLGLSIARKIVEMHGGKIWLRTSQKNGYTKAFIIELQS